MITEPSSGARFPDTTVERHLHFALPSSAAAWPDVELVIAPGARHRLERHTDDSLAALAGTPGAESLPVAELTHRAVGPVRTPKHYLAPWYVMVTDPANGQRHVALCGTLVPDHGRRRPTGVHLATTAMDLAVFMIQHSSEMFSGYTSPDPDEDVAGLVAALIRDEPTVADFAAYLRGQGLAYATMVDVLDPTTGEPTFVEEMDNSTGEPTGRTVRLQTNRYTAATMAHLALPLERCTTIVRNEAALQGWIWHVGQGHAARIAPTTSDERPPGSAVVASTTSVGAAGEVTTFAQTGSRSARGFSVTLDTTGPVDTRSFTITVTNKYMRWITVSAAFVTADGYAVNPDRPPAFTLLPGSTLHDPASFQTMMNQVGAATSTPATASEAMRDVFESLGGITLTGQATFARSGDEVVLSSGTDSYYMYPTSVDTASAIQIDRKVAWGYTPPDSFGAASFWNERLSSDTHRLIGIVSGVDYFAQMAGSYESRSYSIPMPPGAQRCIIAVSGLAFGPLYNMARPSFAYTALLNLSLPMFLLWNHAQALGSSSAIRAIMSAPDGAGAVGGIDAGVIAPNAVDDQIEMGVLGHPHQDLGPGLRSGGLDGGMITSVAAETITVLKDEPSIAAIMVATVAANYLLDAVPIAGAIVMAAACAMDTAQIATTMSEVALSPGEWTTTVAETFSCAVTASPDPLDRSGFPATARFMAIDVVFLDGTNSTSGVRPFQSDGRVLVDPVTVTVGDLPAAGFFRVEVSLYAADDAGQPLTHNPVGVGRSGEIDASRAAANAVAIAVRELLVPLVNDTRYTQARKLGFDSATGRHEWGGSDAAVPTATQAALEDDGANDSRLALLRKITFAGASEYGQIGVAWKGGGQHVRAHGSPSTATNLFTMQALSSQDDPERAFAFTSEGFLEPTLVCFELAPPDAPDAEAIRRDPPEPGRPLWQQLGYARPPINIFLQPATTARGDEVYFVRALSTDGSFTLDQVNALGQLPAPPVDVAIHPDGFVVAVTFDQQGHAQLFKLLLRDSPQDSAPTATPLSGYGTRVNLLQAPVAVDVARDGTVLVLDQAAGRVQAFDKFGNPAYLYFTGASASDNGTRLALRSHSQARRVVHLDLAVERRGYLYVLVLASDEPAGQEQPADYHLEIYRPDGEFLVDATRVRPGRPGDAPMPCGRIAVDLFRNVYALDFESFAGPGGRVEPAVSHLVPSVPAKDDLIDGAHLARHIDLRFDAGSRIVLEDAPALRFLGNAPFTIEALIRSRSNDDSLIPLPQGSIFGRYGAGGGYALGLHDGQLTVTRGAVTLTASDVTLNSLEWYQVAVTYDGTTLWLYIDGVPQVSLTATDVLADRPTPTLRIAGTWPAAGDPGPDDPLGFDFSGDIQRIAVLNRSLSAQQVNRARFALPPAVSETANVWTELGTSVVGYYDFTVSPARDASTTGLSLGDVRGSVGNWLSTRCFSFPGTVAVGCGNHPRFNRAVAAPWTFEAWIAPAQEESTGTLVSKAAGDVGVSLRLDGGYLCATVGATVTHGVTVLQQQIWQHVAAVYDGATLTLLINGVPDASAPLAAASVAGDVPVMIGARFDGTGEALIDYFTGYLQEVRWWGEARTATQLAETMHTVPCTDPTLVAYWSFEFDARTDLTGRYPLQVPDDDLIEDVYRFVAPDATPDAYRSVALRRHGLSAAPTVDGSGPATLMESWLANLMAQLVIRLQLDGMLVATGVVPAVTDLLAAVNPLLQSAKALRCAWELKDALQSEEPARISPAMTDLLFLMYQTGALELLATRFFGVAPQLLHAYGDAATRAMNDLAGNVGDAVGQFRTWLTSQPEAPDSYPAIVVSGAHAEEIPLTEGGSVSLGVALTFPPTQSVTVSLSTDARFLTLSQPTLTFDGDNYAHAQQIVVTALARDAAEAPPGTRAQGRLFLETRSTDAATVYDRLGVSASVNVSVAAPSAQLWADGYRPADAKIPVPDGGRGFTFCLTADPLSWPVHVEFAWPESPDGPYWEVVPATLKLDQGVYTANLTVQKCRTDTAPPATVLTPVATTSTGTVLKARTVIITEADPAEEETLELRSYYPHTGDCYVLVKSHRNVGANKVTKVLLCDGGESQAMAGNIDSLPETIDYLCCTHVDADHIEGLLTLLTNAPQRIAADARLWFNPPPTAPAPGASTPPVPAAIEAGSRSSVRSVLQGRSLRNQWSALRPLDLSMSTPTTGLPLVAPIGAQQFPMLPRPFPKADITVLGPTVANLAAFNAAVTRQDTGTGRNRYQIPGKLVNRASIILQCTTDHGTRILMTGDAWDKPTAQDIVQSNDPPVNTPLWFDVLKVPHHGSGLDRRGSARSTTREFFQRCRATIYLISARVHRSASLPTADVLKWIVESRRFSDDLACNSAPLAIYVTSDVPEVRKFFTNPRYASYLPLAANYHLYLLNTDADPAIRYMGFTWEKGELTQRPEDHLSNQVTAVTS